MIEKLKELIKTDNLTEFKSLFAQSSINAHHKELLFEISYIKQNKDFIDFLEPKVNLNEEKRINIFMAALDNKVAIQNLSLIDNISDVTLSKSLTSLQINKMIEKVQESVLKEFFNKFPLTHFVNYKKFIYSSMKSHKEELTEFYLKQEVDKETIFYSALCASYFEKNTVLAKILYDGQKRFPTLFEDIKKLKNKFLRPEWKRQNGTIQISYEKIEDFERFINHTVIEAFSHKLDTELAKKDGMLSTKKKLKL